MRPLRIVRIVSRLAIGGPAVQISHLAAALDPERFESHLIAGRPSGGEGDMSYLAEQLRVDTIKVPSLRRELSLFHDLLTVWRLTEARAADSGRRVNRDRLRPGGSAPYWR